ncbi:MAG: 2-C-methyl-D-erythritol 4-phosphate cytidylyltransferase [Desulfarculus sp.]|nr:2-C-methyl-D-erythritol 4-phosphate cytidylyltransferase [Desulfarculus sp.]
MVVAVVPAAGSGRRMGAAQPKQFLTLGGLPLLSRTCALLEDVPQVERVVVVAPPGKEDELRRLCLAPYHLPKVALVVPGGRERQDSVAAGALAAANLGAKWVLVHDAVRPLAPPELFGRVLAAAKACGAAVAAVPCQDTVKEAGPDQRVQKTLDRSRLWLAQTPQGFGLDLLLEAQRQAKARGLTVTDEAGLLEAMGQEVRLVPGSRENLKITTPDDLDLARRLVGEAQTRSGQGLDVHRLTPGRPLILGGVRLDYELGLLGHSDADVLTHAVMDALLAAAGLGDIGRLFPDSDPAFKDADSLGLLALVRDRLAQEGWRVLSLSVTLMAQRPKIAPQAPAMAANLARVLGLAPGEVNVAATTSEGLGFTGRGEGMAALALATIIRQGAWPDPRLTRNPRSDLCRL